MSRIAPPPFRCARVTVGATTDPAPAEPAKPFFTEQWWILPVVVVVGAGLAYVTRGSW